MGVGVPCPGTGGFWVSSDGIVTLQYNVPVPLILGAQILLCQPKQCS